MIEISKDIYLITSYNGFYGQSRKPWISVNTDNIIKYLRDGGYTIHPLEYHQAVAQSAEIKNSTVLYSFSQVGNTRFYLRDLMHLLQSQNNLLLPSYDLLLCHENKGYQELYKQRMGIGDLWGLYLESSEQIDQFEISYPVVLKAVGGSNAKGVHLVHNREELLKHLKAMEGSLSLYHRLDLARRRLFRGNQTFPGWEKYAAQPDIEQYQRHISPRTRFVLQEFVPGLDCDYRVIVLGDRFFVSRRLTRPGDWRASGTKLFTYSEIPDPDILNYAQALFEKVGMPVLAMDLGKSERGINLFEFQGSHFGITPIHKGPGYFTRQSRVWTFVKTPGDFERYLADAVIGYRKDKLPRNSL